MTKRHHQKATLPALACATAFALTAQTQAEVMVYFEQADPTTVTAKWSGTLDPGNFLFDRTEANISTANGGSLLHGMAMSMMFTVARSPLPH